MTTYLFTVRIIIITMKSVYYLFSKKVYIISHIIIRKLLLKQLDNLNGVLEPSFFNSLILPVLLPAHGWNCKQLCVKISGYTLPWVLLKSPWPKSASFYPLFLTMFWLNCLFSKLPLIQVFFRIFRIWDLHTFDIIQ